MAQLIYRVHFNLVINADLVYFCKNIEYFENCVAKNEI